MKFVSLLLFCNVVYGKMNAFELNLMTTKVDAIGSGPGLRLTLKNISKKDQYYFHDPMRMPTSLIFTNSKVEILDTRKEKQKVSKKEFLKLKPNEEVVLVETYFKKNSSGFQLDWDCFAYKDLKPGTYSIQATFSSKFSGKLTSNILDVSI